MKNIEFNYAQASNNYQNLEIISLQCKGQKIKQTHRQIVKFAKPCYYTLQIGHFDAII